jgi:hypothetical protein
MFDFSAFLTSLTAATLFSPSSSIHKKVAKKSPFGSKNKSLSQLGYEIILR